MSDVDEFRGRRREPAHPNSDGRGEGHALLGRCDECGKSSANRHPLKVMRGPLRGLRGLVCRVCKDARAVPA